MLLTRWLIRCKPEELLLRTLWIEMLSTASADPGGVDRVEPREARSEFFDASLAAGVPDAALAAGVPDAALAAGVPDAALAAGMLSLVTRGSYVSTIEEPAHWTPERAGRVAQSDRGRPHQ
ncbi:hypothetical protein [Streptomyces sp. Qhu_M48]|uniref:hypothetical protein n=1 Tax=Streptomyces sp. Qhu_M48 TaxID=3435889 RepID=UPI003F4FCF45